LTDTVSSEVRSRIMQAVPTRHTTPEMVVRKAAFAMGHRFRLHRKDLPGSPDLVFPGKKKAIFVHGCFWHRHACPRGRSTPASRLDYWLPKFERNQIRDRRVQRELKKLGWSYLVIWECQTKDAAKLVARLAKFLDV
jgi:DNA mismatch endonuclease (patch repair protein)